VIRGGPAGPRLAPPRAVPSRVALRALARLLALVAVAWLAFDGCASSGKGDENVQRATEGPTAEEIYMARFVGDYGRLPTFEESSAFRADLENRVSQYLSRHPALSTSPRASQFTFHRRVAVGMTPEEVTLLIGVPYATTREPAAMAKAAGPFWAGVGQKAREMWSYPGGWYCYFDGDRLVDLTVSGKEPL